MSVRVSVRVTRKNSIPTRTHLDADTSLSFGISRVDGVAGVIPIFPIGLNFSIPKTKVRVESTMDPALRPVREK